VCAPSEVAGIVAPMKIKKVNNFAPAIDPKTKKTNTNQSGERCVQQAQ
jgi:hypothetical protein